MANAEREGEAVEKDEDFSICGEDFFLIKATLYAVAVLVCKNTRVEKCELAVSETFCTPTFGCS